MLVIRLSRLGKKNQPAYRIVVSDKLKDTYGDYLDRLGFYNPLVRPKEFKINVEKLNGWLAKGAKASPTIHNLLVDQKIITGSKLRSGGRTKAKASTKEEAKK